MSTYCVLSQCRDRSLGIIYRDRQGRSNSFTFQNKREPSHNWEAMISLAIEDAMKSRLSDKIGNVTNSIHYKKIGYKLRVNQRTRSVSTPLILYNLNLLINKIISNRGMIYVRVARATWGYKTNLYLESVEVAMITIFDISKSGHVIQKPENVTNTLIINETIII